MSVGWRNGCGGKMDGRASGGRERQRERHKWPTKLEGFAHDGRLGRSAGGRSEMQGVALHSEQICARLELEL